MDQGADASPPSPVRARCGDRDPHPTLSLRRVRGGGCPISDPGSVRPTFALRPPSAYWQPYSAPSARWLEYRSASLAPQHLVVAAQLRPLAMEYSRWSVKVSLLLAQSSLH